MKKTAIRAILNHPYVTMAIWSFLAFLTMSTLLYTILGVLVPAKRISNGLETDCSIVSAKLWCWRRKPLSFSQIEQGHHSCWLFHVTYNATEASNNTTESTLPDSLKISNMSAEADANDDFDAVNATCVNKVFEVQYSPVHAFPKERDNCDSLESCGNTTWSCNAVTSGSGFVRLRWKFPVTQMVLHTFLFLCSLCASVAYGLRNFKSVCFDFRKYFHKPSPASEIAVAFEDINSGVGSIHTDDFESRWFEPKNSFHGEMSTNEIVQQLDLGTLEIDPHLPDDEIERRVDNFISSRPSTSHRIIDINR